MPGKSHPVDLMDFEKQGNEPLFADILWSRPLTRNRGGKLVVVGGHSNGFATIQAAHQIAEASGIGECLVIMPDSLSKIVAGAPDTILVPSSQSGSIGKAALATILAEAEDSDALMVGIDLTNNSETSVVVESLLDRYRGPLIITEEALDSLPSSLSAATDNSKAVLIGSMNMIINIANRGGHALRVSPERQLLGRLDVVRQVANISNCALVILGREIIIASGGRLSVTPIQGLIQQYPAAQTGFAPFLLANSTKRFEALTTAAFILSKSVPSDSRLTYSQIARSVQTTLQHFS